MYDESLIQTLYGILIGTNAATIRRQYIGDLNAFILEHIPYAQVEAKDVQTALISFDGPQAQSQNGLRKPLLVWHFGGLPYPIVKAALAEYNYQRMWDGSGQTVHASILLGFQSEADSYSLPISPRAQFASVARAFVSESIAKEGFVAQLTAAVTGLATIIPDALVTGNPTNGDLGTLINTHIDGLEIPIRRETSASPAAESHGTSPRGLRDFQSGPFTIEFDGPARDADSHHIFPYTLETLFADKDKFDQILWWYFGGKPVRITKAMRIPLNSDANSPSLFVGYSGPGSFP